MDAPSLTLTLTQAEMDAAFEQLLGAEEEAGLVDRHMVLTLTLTLTLPLPLPLPLTLSLTRAAHQEPRKPSSVPRTSTTLLTAKCCSIRCVSRAAAEADAAFLTLTLTLPSPSPSPSPSPRAS